MFSREMPEEIGGYNIRSFKDNSGIITASLYRGKGKVGDITHGNGILDVKLKNDKEEMAYETSIETNKLDEDFVCSLLDRAELAVFEETLKGDCETMTVFTLKAEPNEVRRVEKPYTEGGKEWLAETHGDDVEICYNAQL